MDRKPLNSDKLGRILEIQVQSRACYNQGKQRKFSNKNVLQDFEKHFMKLVFNQAIGMLSLNALLFERRRLYLF